MFDINELLDLPSEKRAQYLVHSGRVFPNGWWHGTELETGIELMQSVLTDELSLSVSIPTEKLERIVAEGDFDELDDEGEDAIRLETIKACVVAINKQLAGARQRLHLFDPIEGWEDGEPLYLLLSDEEHRQLKASLIPRQS